MYRILTQNLKMQKITKLVDFCIFCLDGYERKDENKKEIFTETQGGRKKCRKTGKVS